MKLQYRFATAAVHMAKLQHRDSVGVEEEGEEGSPNAIWPQGENSVESRHLSDTHNERKEVRSL